MSTPPPHSATFDVTATLDRLAAHRPLFHSEADFQHALAWQLHLDDAQLRIRPEYCPDPGERARADIWTVTPNPGTRTAFELKYFVRAVDTTMGGERFVLRLRADRLPGWVTAPGGGVRPRPSRRPPETTAAITRGECGPTSRLPTGTPIRSCGR